MSPVPPDVKQRLIAQGVWQEDGSAATDDQVSSNSQSPSTARATETRTPQQLTIQVTGVMPDGLPNPGGGYDLTIDLHVANDTTQELTFSFHAFSLHDGRGRTWQPQTCSCYEAFFTDTTDKTIQAGFAIDALIGFTIPTDAAGLWLQIPDGQHVPIHAQPPSVQ